MKVKCWIFFIKMNSILRGTNHFLNIPFNFGKNPSLFKKNPQVAFLRYVFQALEFLNFMAVSSSKKIQYGCLLISHSNNFWKFPMEWKALAAMLTLSRGVQPCTHANSTLCSTRYWLVPLVTGLFFASSACYWLVPLVPYFRNVGL